MAVIKKDGNFMGLPMNIARGNPIPLDKSEIWYSYAEMEEYARTSAVAYVGQMLGLVDEETNTSTAYIILNTAGDLQKIGTSTINADNQSLTIQDEIIALKNWGVQYYKYNSETKGYILQKVDENNPWIAGLEPKVTKENDVLVLAWYEPDPSTIDGINSQIEDLQEVVDNIKTNTYTKTEVDKKVAEAGHLKRIIVDSKDDININAIDADQYIYMVLVSPEDTADKYDEYMVMIYTDSSGEETRYLEKVGSWEVDLSNYVTKETLTTELGKKVDAQAGFGLISDSDKYKLSQIQVGAQKNFINEVDDTHFEVTDRKLFLKSITSDKVSDLQNLLNQKVDKEEGKGLSSNDFTTSHIQAIQSNTQNLTILSGKISNIETTLHGTEETDGLIEIVDLMGVTLSEQADSIQAHGVTIGSLESITSQHSLDIQTLNSTVGQLSDKITGINLNNYITKEMFQATVGNINELKLGQKTLHTQVKELQQALTWGEMTTTN